MTLVWTVENQDAAGKWFRVTPKLFEDRFDAIEWCNTLRERWAESGSRSRLRIRLTGSAGGAGVGRLLRDDRRSGKQTADPGGEKGSSEQGHA